MTAGTLGSNTITENSECRVNAAASSASGAGNILTVNLALTFKSKLTGANGVYFLAQNYRGWLPDGSRWAPRVSLRIDVRN